MRIILIAAVEDTGGIGWLGSLPWPNISADMKHFAKLTTEGVITHKCNYTIPNCETAVVMGRKTWDSIPHKFRPLPNRTNLVLTNSKKSIGTNYIHCRTLESVISQCVNRGIDDLFVIGGEQIYNLFLNFTNVDFIYLTKIKGVYKCDRWFPQFNGTKISESEPEIEDGIEYKFSTYEVGYE